MTNKEAIKNIYKMIMMYGYAEFGEQEVEALEMAIDALSAEQKDIGKELQIKQNAGCGNATSVVGSKDSIQTIVPTVEQI